MEQDLGLSHNDGLLVSSEPQRWRLAMVKTPIQGLALVKFTKPSFLRLYGLIHCCYIVISDEPLFKFTMMRHLCHNWYLWIGARFVWSWPIPNKLGISGWLNPRFRVLGWSNPRIRVLGHGWTPIVGFNHGLSLSPMLSYMMKSFLCYVKIVTYYMFQYVNDVF